MLEGKREAGANIHLGKQRAREEKWPEWWPLVLDLWVSRWPSLWKWKHLLLECLETSRREMDVLLLILSLLQQTRNDFCVPGTLWSLETLKETRMWLPKIWRAVELETVKVRGSSWPSLCFCLKATQIYKDKALPTAPQGGTKCRFFYSPYQPWDGTRGICKQPSLLPTLSWDSFYLVLSPL